LKPETHRQQFPGRQPPVFATANGDSNEDKYSQQGLQVEQSFIPMVLRQGRISNSFTFL
jgi:hypothetical protein